MRVPKQAHSSPAKAARRVGVSRVTMKTRLVQFGTHFSQIRNQLT